MERIFERRHWVIPFIYFFFLWIYSGFLGISDDEAYYWALSRDFRWGFAYHPPMTLWSIQFFDHLFGWALRSYPTALVRLPACFFATSIFSLAIYWFYRSGLRREHLWFASVGILAVPGLFGFSWMMVPDLPLIFGWMLGFVSTFVLIKDGFKWTWVFCLCVATAIAVLSKFSGVQVPFSAFIAILFSRLSSREKSKALMAIVFATLIALKPVLHWNMIEDWLPLKYQLSDRHANKAFSLIRYLRFWVLQILLVGPIIFVFVWNRLWKWSRKNFFFFAWFVPSAFVFWIQPAFSDFKIHWSIIAWLPAILFIIRELIEKSNFIRLRNHIIIGVILQAVILLGCQYPLISKVHGMFSDQPINPKFDVSNDLYGWDPLTEVVKKFDPEALTFPLIGSRYQTASQGAYQWPKGVEVARAPVPAIEKSDWWWPEALENVEFGKWPRVLRPVVYVADFRYSEGPKFPQTDCQDLGRHQTVRYGEKSRWIQVWICRPISRE